MYSFSYLEPVCCAMSRSNCCFLTCIHVSQEADQVVWYSHLFQNFPQFRGAQIILLISCLKNISYHAVLRKIYPLAPWEKSYEKPRHHIKKHRHYFANKGPSSQGYGFSSGHVWMWELDCEESWVLKNWCFWTVVLEKTLESPLDCQEIQPVHPKGDQSWVFIGKTDI